MYKPEVEKMPQTGSTNNLSTKTDIDAISCFFLGGGGKFFTDVYADLPDACFTKKFQDGRRISEVVKTLWRNNINNNITNIKVILAAGAMFYVCIATEIASISVFVDNLLVLPVLGTVSTSGFPLIQLSEVGQYLCPWEWIERALKHCHSSWDYLDIVFRRKVITTSGIRPPCLNFWVKEASDEVGIYTSDKLAPKTQV